MVVRIVFKLSWFKWFLHSQYANKSFSCISFYLQFHFIYYRFFSKKKIKKERNDLYFTICLSRGKAAGYESQVQVNEGKSVERISMNHPLKEDGYTVYQSGFEEDEKGVPVASVFSINKDPGRFVKYFGSLLIVLGSLILFLRRNYFKT